MAFESKESNDEVELMSSFKEWDLIVSSVSRTLAKHEFFLVHFGSDEDFKEAISAVDRINQSQLLGRGYWFHAFYEPSCGFRVQVKEGFHLSGEKQYGLFLERFVSLASLNVR